MSDPANPANRRLVLGVVSLVVGGILIAAASIGISVQLDRQAREEAAELEREVREQGECRIDARNVEFEGLKTEMGATTGLIEFAIKNPDPTRAQTEAAIGAYHDALTKAHRLYADAEREFAVC